MSTKLRSFIKSALVLFILSALTAIFSYQSYKSDLRWIDSQAKDILALKKDKVLNFLELLEEDIQREVEVFKSLDHFDEDLYSIRAKEFTNRNKTVLAFNFLNSGFKLSHVYPYEKNKKALNIDFKNHPDPEIKNIFQKGVSRDSIVFTPPVKIIQGGTAVIFYAPVNFRQGSFGWLNIVIRVDHLFEKFIKKELHLKSKVEVKDFATKRVLYSSLENKDHSFSIFLVEEFLGRKIEFGIFLEKIHSEVKKNNFLMFLIIFIIIFLLCVFLYFNFDKNQMIKESLLNAQSERNILRIVFHDLSNPIMILDLGLKKMIKKQVFDEKLLGNLSLRVDQINDILFSLKSLESVSYINPRKNLTPINLKELVEDLFEIHSQKISDKGLSIDFQSEDLIHLNAEIPPSLLKNTVINNIFTNALNHSHPKSTISIKITKESLKVKNSSDLIPEEKLNDLNTFVPAKGAGLGHGFGFYIAKILSKKFGMLIKVSQDPSSQEVTTSLRFNN
ncbi:MAG: signal transduction histidine kinase [Bacteriovoracaceae bacterium]|jgi:signal transduction histidine kinase